MSDTAAESRAPTADEALHTTLDVPFEDAVPFVQIEHELADFETVRVTRLDEMIEGMVCHDDVERTALIVVCHPEIARDALPIDPTLAGVLPCTRSCASVRATIWSTTCRRRRRSGTSAARRATATTPSTTSWRRRAS